MEEAPEPVEETNSGRGEPLPTTIGMLKRARNLPAVPTLPGVMTGGRPAGLLGVRFAGPVLAGPRVDPGFSRVRARTGG
ncbi:MAG: hypothetical protein ACFB50_14165 [Rubrobacteraceae bacterium]